MKQRSLALLAVLAALVMLVSACGGGGAGTNLARTQSQVTSGSQASSGSQPILTDTTSEIGGTIVDAKGKPVAGVEVSVDGSAISAVTNAQGAFALPGVAPGVHAVTVGKDGYTIVTRTVTLVDGASLTLASESRKAVSDVSTDTGQLHGIVSDESSNPIGGAMVIVFNADGYFQVQMSGDDGSYRFTDLPAGPYFILSFKPGYQSYFDQVTIEAGVDKELNITLKSVGTGIVNGTVYDEANNPIAHAAVFLITRNSPTNRTPNFFMFTGDDGKFEFYHVPAGPALLVGFHPGYEPDSKEITVIVGETTTQDLILKGQTTTSLHGMVVDPNNAGIAGATVTLVPGGRDPAGQNHDPNGGGTSGNGVLQTTTDATGHYAFEQLFPGMYIGKASMDGYLPTIEPVPVLPYHDNEHNFVLQPQGTPPPEGFGYIFGHVLTPGTDPSTNQGGVPVAGATVDLFDKPLPPPGSMAPMPAPIGETQTDDQGYYKFDQVPALGQEHPYFLVARKDGLNPDGPKPAYVFPEHGTEVNFFLGPIGPPPPGGNGHIYGHVNAPGSDPTQPGPPIPGATVALFDQALPPPNSGVAPVPPIRTTVTDGNGMYVFGEVPARQDPYFVVANKDGFLPSDPKPAVVVAEQGTEVDFMLIPGPPPQNVPLHGIVWGPAPNHPDQTIGIPGVNVYAAPLMIDAAGVNHGLDPQHIMQTVTGPDGGYGFPVPPGNYVMWTHMQGWTSDIHAVPVGPNGAVQDFFIHPFGPDVQMAVFAGHVKTPTGDPIPQAHVILAMVPPPGWMGPGWFIPVKDTFTGPEGGFGFGQVVPDGYLVVVQKDGFQLFAEARVFQPGDNQTVDYTLYPPPPPQP